jgi:hypothetical protein
VHFFAQTTFGANAKAPPKQAPKFASGSSGWDQSKRVRLDCSNPPSADGDRETGRSLEEDDPWERIFEVEGIEQLLLSHCLLPHHGLTPRSVRCQAYYTRVAVSRECFSTESAGGARSRTLIKAAVRAKLMVKHERQVRQRTCPPPQHHRMSAVGRSQSTRLPWR